MNFDKIIEKFLKAKDLYQMAKSNNLFDDYFYDKEQLQLYRALEAHWFVNLERCKNLMSKDRKLIDSYIYKLSWNYTESKINEEENPANNFGLLSK